LLWRFVLGRAVFALVHGMAFYFPTLFLSFVLGSLKMKNEKLRLCFLLEAANNSFPVLVGYFSCGG